MNIESKTSLSTFGQRLCYVLVAGAFIVLAAKVHRGTNSYDVAIAQKQAEVDLARIASQQKLAEQQNVDPLTKAACVDKLTKALPPDYPSNHTQTFRDMYYDTCYYRR